MDNLLSAIIADPLSDDDIRHITKGRCNILKYEQLKDMKSLDEVFEPHGSAIILYETAKDFGHWVALIREPGRQKNVIEFFDSYGLAPDDELKMVPSYFRNESNQNYPHLTWLIEHSPYQCQWNEIDFQESKNNVNTCGRWAAARVLWRNVRLNQFQDFLLNQRLSPDQYIAALTMDTLFRD